MEQAAVEMRDKTEALLMPEEKVVAQEFASNWWLRKQGVSLAARQKSSTAGKKTTSPKRAATHPKAPAKPKTPVKPEVKKPQ
jgi:hypothetical protein